MNASSSGDENPFVDLIAFDHIKAPVTSVKSSVVKSSAIQYNGVAKIEIIDGTHAEPAIQVQREGDRIKKIEFICPCGKSAHLDLEYVEE